jgi:nucleotide-binding universal stress UspA family protein
MLMLELLDKFVELVLGRADLLREQTGTFLQVTTYVTHRIIPQLPSTAFKPIKLSSGSGQFLAAQKLRSDVIFEQHCDQAGDSMSASKAVDGSAPALRAVDFAIEMVARNPGPSLVLLHVQNVPAIELAGASEAMAINWLQEAAAQASTKALKDAIGKCEGASVAFETLVRTGQTGEAIARVAREEDVKHIVMGTRGLGGIKGLLLGSVATQVIHLAEVPITLIK